MSDQPQPNAPEGDRTDDALFRDYLLALLDVGATVAQSIKRQAERPPQPTPETEPPHPQPDLAEQFERVSRAMRRTILLARHLAQPNAANPAKTNRVQARKRIIRAVEDAIQLKSDQPETLQAEFRDRLDAPDLEEDIASRPTAEIITDIIRDLGLAHLPGTHPWARRTPRDLAALNARAANPTPPGPHNPPPHGPDLPPDPPERCRHGPTRAISVPPVPTG